MSVNRIHYLLEQYFQNACTAEEKAELADWIEKSGDDQRLRALLEQVWNHFEPTDDMSDARASEILSFIVKKDPVQMEYSAANVKRMRLLRIAAAACIVLLLGYSIYLLSVKKPQSVEEAKKINQAPIVLQDAVPGKTKAILILSDGSHVLLDSAAGGLLAKQGNTSIIKKDGQLVYSRETGGNTETLYNTLETHRGEQYPLTLSDGSKVWLNAASSIRFPVAFSGNERKVEITGEAYFEVAKNPAKPFRVTLNGMEVEVLGTHFNVNGYDDESMIKTTLLEGSVKVSKGSISKIIKPGEQAQTTNQGNHSILQIKVQDVDVDEVVSWKNGYFSFAKADLETVLRQLSRWYDVDIVYKNRNNDLYFEGEIERGLQLSQVLKILEKNNVHFRIEGKNIIVLN